MDFLAKYFLLAFIYLIPFTALSQQKAYKVVCDKNEKKLKIVEADNRSPDYVPVKGGFPFEALAREWIEKNFTTWDCDPQEIIEKRKLNNEEKPPPATNQQPTPPPTTKPSASPSPVQGTPQKTNPNLNANSGIRSKPHVKYKNTSISLILLFHTLDRTLGVDNNKLGLGASLEQLIGKKFYGGTGIHFHLLPAEAGSETVEMYMFKFPVFGGYRLRKGTAIISFDAGVFISTKLTAMEGSEIYFRGHEPSDVSFSFFPRVRIGSSGFQIEVGAELWLNDIIENMDKLSVYHIGVRFSF